METTLSPQTICLDYLLDQVYREAGYDFRLYRRGTVERRLDRRLHASGSPTLADYSRFLDRHPEEYLALADDLTIKVSGFFRSPYTFESAARLVIPHLLRHKAAGNEERLTFWSAACSRGEEPYSIAMLLAEAGENLRGFDVSVQATDLSRQALEYARSGLYAAKEMAGVSPERLAAHFIPQGPDYQVKAEIRRMVSFSSFDLTSSEAPVSSPDAIFCCNVLIYFQRALQERVLTMLYAALAAPGYLILGEVESLPGNLSDRLECIDDKARIYRKGRP